MLNITKGKIDRAQKVVIYGAEGIGKSSLAAKFPDPLFIDTEGGTAHMDVRRIEKPQSWEEMLSVVKEVAATKDVCRTLVLDTADWAEQLIVSYLCTKYKQNSIESFGYGKGYTYLGEEFSRLLGALDTVLTSGVHVVVTAHAKMRKFEQPDEMGAYDRFSRSGATFCSFATTRPLWSPRRTTHRRYRAASVSCTRPTIPHGTRRAACRCRRSWIWTTNTSLIFSRRGRLR